MTNQQKGLLLMFGSASGFAFLPTITRYIYAVSELNPTDIAIWRFTMACIIIWSLFYVTQPKEPKASPIPLWQMGVLGVLYALSALSAFFALQYISASLFVVLFYTYPAMVAILSLLIGIRLSVWAWVALVLTLVGIVFTVPDLSLLTADSALGIVIALANALFVALYFIISARFLSGVSSMLRSTSWVMGITWIVLLFSIPLFGIQAPSNIATILSLIALSIVCTVIPIFCMNAAIQTIGAARASIIGSVEPVVAMLLAVFLLGEQVLPLQWIGAGLIVFAVVLLEASPKKDK